jgi:hypothetical protein
MQNKASVRWRGLRVNRYWIGSMEVTDVKIRPTDEDKLRAYVTIILDRLFS